MNCRRVESVPSGQQVRIWPSGAIAACAFMLYAACLGSRVAVAAAPRSNQGAPPPPIKSTARTVEDACERVPPDWADLAKLLQRLAVLQRDSPQSAQALRLTDRIPAALGRAFESDFRRLVLNTGTSQIEGPRQALQRARTGWRGTSSQCERAVVRALHRILVNGTSTADDSTLVTKTLALCQETDLDVDRVLEGLAATCSTGPEGTCLRIVLALTPLATRPGATGSARHGMELIAERMMREGQVHSVFLLILAMPSPEATGWTEPYVERLLANAANDAELRSPLGADFLARVDRDLRMPIPAPYWLEWSAPPNALMDECAAGALTARSREALELLVAQERWGLLDAVALRLESAEDRLWLRDLCMARIAKLREVGRLDGRALRGFAESGGARIGVEDPFSDDRQRLRPTPVPRPRPVDPKPEWRAWGGRYAHCDVSGKAGVRWLDAEREGGFVGADLLLGIVSRDLFARGTLDYLQQLDDGDTMFPGRWERWRLTAELDRGLAPASSVGIRPAFELLRVRSSVSHGIPIDSTDRGLKRWWARYAVELPMRAGLWFGSAASGRWVRLGAWGGPRFEVPHEGLGESRWQAIAGGDAEVRVDGNVVSLLVRGDARRFWDRDSSPGGLDEAVGLGRLLFGWPSFKFGPEGRVIATGDLLREASRARTEGVVSLVFSVRFPNE